MKRIVFFLVTILLSGICSVTTTSQTKVIAHRGYWKCEGSAQNSIAALNKAGELKIYGSELDVHITADGVPVINHDDSICGKAIEFILYKELNDCRLNNGERVPTMEEYLIAGKDNPGTKLIIEIKPHKKVINEDRAVEAILNLVSNYKMEDQVEYISFSMNICKELMRKAPEAEVAYLMSDVPPRELKALGFTGLDYHYKAFEKYPEWISEAKQLGLTVNVWTVNDRSKMEELIAFGVDYITTDEPAILQEMLSKTASK